MLNIATLAAASSAALHLKSPTGEPLYDGDKPVRIILHSPGSVAFSQVESRQTARIAKRMNDNDGKIAVASADEERNDAAQDLATLTIAFENLTYGDGSLQGDELFRAVYADPKLGWIVRQVRRFVNDWGNFTGASNVS